MWRLKLAAVSGIVKVFFARGLDTNQHIRETAIRDASSLPLSNDLLCALPAVGPKSLANILTLQ